MADTKKGRNREIEKLRYAAEAKQISNKAFFGLKGVGKTTMFLDYLTADKRRSLANDNKKIFVVAQIDSKKKGSDLYKFLIDQVKIGVKDITNDEKLKRIEEELSESDNYESLDARLYSALEGIRGAGYQFIVIMDHFHCMSRNTEIGDEQYNLLRQLNEGKLITYWIITDTDLMETCATQQFIASFFAQKFTDIKTILPLNQEECMEVIERLSFEKDVELDSDEMEIVYQGLGGIPALVTMFFDAARTEKDEDEPLTEDYLYEIIMSNDGCVSLLESWTSGLTLKQKRLLFETASSEDGISETDLERLGALPKDMAALADQAGRGLLIKGKNDSRKAVWHISVGALKRYICDQGEEFCKHDSLALSADMPVGTSSVPGLPGVSAAKPSESSGITQIFNITGNYIQNQTNNVINIENAVAGLEDLHHLIYGNTALLDEKQVLGKLGGLPFRDAVWTELSEEEQETETEKYAEGILSSPVFAAEQLTPMQMSKFNLTENLLSDMSDNCRSQIICGVQVYDIIQMCIDRFGLSVGGSESPRGILFARAFERHLKDFAAPAFLRVPEMANRNVYPTDRPFKNYDINKTTIGTYEKFLESGKHIFSQASTQLLGYPDRDYAWWDTLCDRLEKIGNLRNECCHSGISFDSAKLGDLIDRVFTQNSFDDLLIFGQIPVLQQGQFPKNGRSNSNTVGNGGTDSTYPAPDIRLLGQNVQFTVQKKTARGNFQGVVNGVYGGSLPKSSADKLIFTQVKGTTITVKAEKIQDGRYVLKL